MNPRDDLYENWPAPAQPRDLLREYCEERRRLDALLADIEDETPESSDRAAVLLACYCVAVVLVLLSAPLWIDLAQTWGPVIRRWITR